MTIEPLIYVCMMSAFNLPEFESCLLRKPSHLVLVVSDYAPAQVGAELFEQTIKQWANDKITILRPDQQCRFEGKNFIQYQNWLQNTLNPILDSLPAELPRACNITGGTKLMALGLFHVRDWAWIDYKAEQRHELQEFAYEKHTGQIQLKKELSLPLATAKQVANLYSRRVDTTPINRITKGKGHVEQALRLWDGLSREDTALLSIFGNESHGLEHVWMYGRNNKTYNKRQIDLDIKTFIGSDSLTDEQYNWIAGWADMAPDSLQYKKDEGIITLPGNRGSDLLKRWLSGDWLELLVGHWLEVDAQIPDEQIAVNLKTNPNEMEAGSSKQANYGERETDIMVHTEKGTTVIEIKTDLPPHTTGMQEAIRQITSFGDRVGRSEKILFIGPQLYKKIAINLNEIELSCKAAKVKLCATKEDLLRLFQ